MARFTTSLHKGATRYPKTISFRGMDITTPRFQVAEDRAIDSVNYLWKDGAVHKRHGTEDEWTFDGKYSYRALNGSSFSSVSTNAYLESEAPSTNEINNVRKDDTVYDLWIVYLSDTASHAGMYFVIAHKGTLLLSSPINHDSMEPIASKTTSLSTDGETVYYAFRMPERKLYAVESKGFLWLLTGDGYYRISYTSSIGIRMEKVADSDFAYVPTTTIGITANEAVVGRTRNSYESVNLLSEWRKNGLASGIKTEGNESATGAKRYTYSLDGRVKCRNASDLSKIRVVIHTTGEKNEDD